jgi:hypothetical protein
MGDWDLVVVRGDDDMEVVKGEGYTIASPMTLTSISPTTGQTNNESVAFALVGTGFSDVSNVILYNENYDNITADTVDVISSVKIKGTFDLSGAAEATYDVCVMDSYGTEECDLSFEVTTDAVGSIVISSTPSDASIYVDGTYIGTTPGTVNNLIEGYHKLVLKKTGYTDWGKMVTVESGETSTVNADLVVITAVPTTVSVTVPTALQTTASKTVRTKKANTIMLPTSWPSTTITQASPVDPVVIIGVVELGLGFAACRKP